MSSEDFFTRIIVSYKRLLLSSGKTKPSLREYCHSRHVVWRDFIRWASTHANASGLLEVECRKRRLQKEPPSLHKSGSSQSACAVDASAGPLLYPLHIVAGSCESEIEPVSNSCGLRGVCITFPNGVQVSVSEADSRGVYFLVHGKDS